MKKILLSIVCMTFMFVSVPVYALEDTSSTGNQETISARADKLEWIYRIIDGKLYKRLWNRTQNRWEGDWIRA
ncbi:hypothetical protein [uncultured Faecalicoccus sp.]|uniref:hypothetical protein n=1 Tax=uncultured Faecalicoccus sp. TaxID=1971760 RepID=UPI00262455EC|nr:hypothetical protein [uncultured Faecalicoccus sp.]